jgi:branched-chain amino acid transport system substrate-binding protein
VKKVFLGLLVVMLVVSFVLAGSSLAGCSKQSGGTIKIGGIYELTGGLAPMGDEMKKATEVGFQILGTTIAGKNVQFILEDDASDSATALDKGRKLVETDKVNLLWGPINGGHRAALAGYLDRVKVPNISTAGDIDAAFLEHKWMWGPGGNESQISYPTGVYALSQGYKTATVIAEDRSAGQEFLQLGFEPAFKAGGGQIIQEQWYPTGTKDFTPYIANMKQADCIAAWIGDVAGFSGFPQLAKAGNKMPIIQVEHGGLILSPVASKEIGDSIKGVVTATIYYYSLNTPGNKQFVDAYQAKWGTLPGPFAGMQFRTMQITYAALQKTNGDTNPDKLAVALNQPVDTICGRYEFTPEHCGIFPVFVVKIGDDLQPRLIKSYISSALKEGEHLVPKVQEVSLPY